MTDSKRELQPGGCLCGAIRFEIDRGTILAASHCHCKDCQRSTGCAFATFCMVPEAGFRSVSGEPRFYGVTGTSGGNVERGFCGDCGSPLYSKVAMAPGILFVKAGSLDDATWIEPSASYWGASAQPWAPANTELPIHEGNPG